MATDCGMFLKFVVVLATTTWFTCPPLTNEETVLISEMAEELQLEIKSQIYAVDWSSLGRIAEFLKVEHEDKSNLAEAKHVVQRLEEELGKIKEAEIVPYLEDVKKLLTEKASSGWLLSVLSHLERYLGAISKLTKI